MKYISLGIIAISIMLFGCESHPNESMDGIEIELKNIELINVSPNSCWTNSFNEEMCPIPNDIRLKIDGLEIPVSMEFIEGLTE